MLIILQKGIESLPRSEKLIRCLENLLLASDEGKHVVIAPRKVANGLLNWRELEGRKRALIALRDRAVELISWRQSVSVEILVENRDDSSIFRDDQSERTVFHVPWSWFTDSLKVQASTLLVEADDDTVVFEQGARAWISWNRKTHPGAQCSLVTDAAGGGNIKPRYRRLISEEKIVLAIADSERKTANESIGDTALGLKHQHNELAKTGVDGVFDFHILRVHELENLIPASLLEDALSPEKQSDLTRWKSADQLFPHGLYLDRKKGTDTLPALGEHMAHVARHLEKLTPQKIAEHLFPIDDDDIWADLGYLIFSWGCATRRLRLS